MLFGLYDPDEGEVLLRGEPIKMQGPRDAIRRGVGMVHQHFQLVPVFTVAENIMLGAEETSGPFLDPSAAGAADPRDVGPLRSAVDPEALVEDLAVGTQQRVEILKALYRQADILILDEPTAVLTPAETDELLGVMKELAAAGHVDHLHHPQAARGHRRVRHHHGVAGRQGGRHHHPRRPPTGPGWRR